MGGNLQNIAVSAQNETTEPSCILMLCDNIPQLIAVLYDIVCDVAIRNCGEVTTCTLYLHAFGSTVVLQAIFVVTFCFCYEVDVFDVTALMEYHSPVGIIVSHWRIDVEAIWQFCIDDYFVSRVI